MGVQCHNKGGLGLCIQTVEGGIKIRFWLFKNMRCVCIKNQKSKQSANSIEVQQKHLGVLFIRLGKKLEDYQKNCKCNGCKSL